jgi:streptogramin lyase
MSRLISFIAGTSAVAAALAWLPATVQAASADQSSAQRLSRIAASAGAQTTTHAPRIVFEDYPVPASLAYTLLPSDPGVVSNGPIPDTPANRARDGAPLSHAGRSSLPIGD